MRITITGHNLPGRHWCSADENLDNVHVALLERRDPIGLVPGDAASASWDVEVGIAVGADGRLDFKGPAVQGKRGERFLYLTWGNVGPGHAFAMFRRAKLMLGAIDPALVAAAERDGKRLLARVNLTDGRGGPRGAQVKPPALAWSVE
jgi:hypothetical protein